MSGTAAQNAIAVVGVDIGKNSFHVVGLDDRGAIVLRQKWSRSQVEARTEPLMPEAIRRLTLELKPIGPLINIDWQEVFRPASSIADASQAIERGP